MTIALFLKFRDSQITRTGLPDPMVWALAFCGLVLRGDNNVPQNDRISVSCECLMWDTLTWNLRAFREPWETKEERPPSAQLFSAAPERLECPQGIASSPTTKPWIWGMLCGGHHFEPYFLLSDLVRWLFSEDKLSIWHSLQIGGGRGGGGSKAGPGGREGSGPTCWAPVSCWAGQLGSAAGGAAS